MENNLGLSSWPCSSTTRKTGLSTCLTTQVLCKVCDLLNKSSPFLSYFLASACRSVFRYLVLDLKTVATRPVKSLGKLLPLTSEDLKWP